MRRKEKAPLGFRVQPAGILVVTPVHDISERRHPAAIVKNHRPHDLAIDIRHLLAFAQIGNDVVAVGHLDPEGQAAAGAAMVKTEHQAGLGARTAMHPGINAQRTVHAGKPRRPGFDMRKTRPPHQRAVTENPEFIHPPLSQMRRFAYQGRHRAASKRQGLFRLNGTMRRFTVILAVLIAAVGGIWFGVWTVIAGRIDGAVANGLAEAADQGLALSCDGQQVGGFPLRFDVICGKIDAAEATTGLQAAMAGLRTATPVYWPWQSKADLASPLRLTGGSLPAPVDITWSAAAISLDSATPVPDRVAFSATDLQAALGGVAVTTGSTRAEAEPTPDKLGATLALTAVASRLLWQGRQTDAANITAQAWIDAPPDAVMRGVFDPSRTGLSIPDLTIRLATGDALIQVSGPVRFDRSGQLSGKITVHIIGVEALPAFISSLPAAAQPPANAFVGGVLTLGTPATLDGRDAKALALRIDGGVVRMGPVALLHIPPLF